MAGKRRFGRVRELPFGRWQARYKGPDGIDRPAPRTFDSKTSAERWLTLTEAEIIQGGWIDPDAGRVLFSLDSAFSARALADIKEPNVRRWRKTCLMRRSARLPWPRRTGCSRRSSTPR